MNLIGLTSRLSAERYPSSVIFLINPTNTSPNMNYIYKYKNREIKYVKVKVKVKLKHKTYALFWKKRFSYQILKNMKIKNPWLNANLPFIRWL